MLSVYKVGVQKNKGSPMLNTTFRKTAAAAALIAATTLSFNVQAQDEKCEPLISENGFTMSAAASAYTYSKENIGEVAISAIPGEDLGNTPLFLAKAFERNEVPAACFINEDGYKKGGTTFNFYVAGGRVKYNGEDTFGIDDLLNNRDILKAVALEATIMAQTASLNKEKPTVVLASND